MGQYSADSGAAGLAYEDFERYITKASTKIAQAFETLDSEHSGCITESGLLAALQHMGFHAKQVRAARNKLRSNGAIPLLCLVQAVQARLPAPTTGHTFRDAHSALFTATQTQHAPESKHSQRGTTNDLNLNLRRRTRSR